MAAKSSLVIRDYERGGRRRLTTLRRDVRAARGRDRLLASRGNRPDLAADTALPDDTRLWAALQDVSGGTWGGSVFDVDEIVRVLTAGRQALAATSGS